MEIPSTISNPPGRPGGGRPGGGRGGRPGRPGRPGGRPGGRGGRRGHPSGRRRLGRYPRRPFWYPRPRGGYWPIWSYGVPYYPRLAVNWFGDNEPACAPPLQRNCRRLNITPRWANECFVPTYRRLRAQYGPDPAMLSSAIARDQAPDCAFPTTTGAGAEYERRIQLAVAVLLNREGYPTTYPPSPPTPRPRQADTIRDPWLRALLTGWV